MSAFGECLAAQRHARGLSQAKLAEAAGIERSYVSRLEGGSRAPSRAMVLALAGALNATPEERDSLLAAAGYAGLMEGTACMRLDAIQRHCESALEHGTGLVSARQIWNIVQRGAA